MANRNRSSKAQMKERLNPKQATDFYGRMLLIRSFEERCAEEYSKGNIRGFLHLYIGEEAIAVGAISALKEQDYIVTHYRDHGHALARGLEPARVMAEMFGKATGTSKGKGGSMHLFDVSRRFMGGWAIVGGQLPLAVGLALASSYKGSDACTLCFFGDGALNQGEFHESLNLASLWKLPVLFFLENNLYGMGSHIDRTYAGGRDVYSAAEHYRIPSRQIDGMDVLEVHRATLTALEQVRAGKGPYFLEALTYRFRGHSMADPQEYRDRKEEEEWRKRDPLLLFRQRMLQDEVLSQADLDGMEREAHSTVEEAVRFAAESPEPEDEVLYQDVLASRGSP